MNMPDWLRYEQDTLVLAGTPLTELIGSTTPTYLYSRTALADRLATVAKYLPNGARIKYALKANPNQALLNFISNRIGALDVASQRELALAKSTGLPISYSGPSKQREEIELAVLAGATVNLESENEIARLIAAAVKLSMTPNVAIRVNPDFGIRSSGMVMSGIPSQFGLEPAKVKRILANWPDELNWVGFHYFAGSQCLDPESLRTYYENVAQDVIRLTPEKFELRSLNVGLSLGVAYNAQESSISIAEVADALALAVGAVTERHPNCQIDLESGRYLVGEAGVFVTRVIDIKESRGELFIVCDGGLNCHLAATGNFGQVIPRNYPLFLSPKRAKRSKMNLVGPLCTPLDIFGRSVEHGIPQEGDIVCIAQSGAYGASASPQGFISRKPVTETLV